jgi:branched-chain amino acid transport system substrate-binding protein
MINHALVVEAISRAQKKYSVKVPNGDQMRWSFENLTMKDADWKRLGLTGFPNIDVTCNDHEGAKGVLFQQWDAKNKKWNSVSDWVPVMRDIVRPMMEADAAKYAKENNITPRNCS